MSVRRELGKGFNNDGRPSLSETGRGQDIYDEGSVVGEEKEESLSRKALPKTHLTDMFIAEMTR